MKSQITPELLADPTNGFTKMIVYIYSMETFIFKEMNMASRRKDESKIKFYGALASALSFIVHCGNQKHTDLGENFTVYRGLQLSTEELRAQYQIGNTFNLKGFTSTTLDRNVALGFAISGLTNATQNIRNTIDPANIEYNEKCPLLVEI